MTSGAYHSPSRPRATAAVLVLFLLAIPPFLHAADTKGVSFDGSKRFSGREVFQALAEAWPGRFSNIQELAGDWIVRLDEEWFRWAGGRLLPLTDKNDGSWDPWPFYYYPKTTSPVRPLDPAELKALETELARRDSAPDHRNPAFFDLLFDAPDHDGAYDRMKTILFFGHEVLVNPDLLEELAAVEREIRDLAKSDASVASWIESIGSVDGFAWRSIAGTVSRSMHSYGAAIDIVPKKSRGLSWYWLDARNSGLVWYELPRSRRIPVPAKVVEAFERRGFVWGGKWFYWDLVHFEYRPDILLLNGFSPAVQKEAR